MTAVILAKHRPGEPNKDLLHLSLVQSIIMKVDTGESILDLGVYTAKLTPDLNQK